MSYRGDRYWRMVMSACNHKVSRTVKKKSPAVNQQSSIRVILSCILEAGKEKKSKTDKKQGLTLFSHEQRRL